VGKNQRRHRYLETNETLRISRSGFSPAAGARAKQVTLHIRCRIARQPDADQPVYGPAPPLQLSYQRTALLAHSIAAGSSPWRCTTCCCFQWCCCERKLPAVWCCFVLRLPVLWECCHLPGPGVPAYIWPGLVNGAAAALPLGLLPGCHHRHPVYRSFLNTVSTNLPLGGGPFGGPKKTGGENTVLRWRWPACC